WMYDQEGYVWWHLLGSGWARSDAFIDTANPDLPAACWQLVPLDEVPPTPASPAEAAAPINTALPAATSAQSCALVTQLEEVNVRSGPGTSYNSMNKLPQNQTIQASAWAFDTDGFVWWRLSTGGWVRADTVEFPESCLQLPQVQP
ncbi:MAG: SH3 domain-containing protein, partial [Chloroflexi bacterium]|nr:SH3 domain-containing protein [Chloroflexota bacterium]